MSMRRILLLFLFSLTRSWCWADSTTDVDQLVALVANTSIDETKRMAALAKIVDGHPADVAVAALEPLLGRAESEVRAFAALGLANLKGPAALDRVRVALTDPSGLVRL